MWPPAKADHLDAGHGFMCCDSRLSRHMSHARRRSKSTRFIRRLQVFFNSFIATRHQMCELIEAADDWHVHSSLLSLLLNFTVVFSLWAIPVCKRGSCLVSKKMEFFSCCWKIENWSAQRKKRKKLKVKFRSLGNWAIKHQQPLKAYYRGGLQDARDGNLHQHRKKSFHFSEKRRSLLLLAGSQSMSAYLCSAQLPLGERLRDSSSLLFRSAASCHFHFSSSSPLRKLRCSQINSATKSNESEASFI